MTLSWAGRLTDVGASSREVAVIQAAYDDSIPSVQTSLDELIAGIDNAGLAVMLTNWRLGAGPFGTGLPGGGLPFGTRVPLLTGNSADDSSAISAGTGVALGGIPSMDNAQKILALVNGPNPAATLSGDPADDIHAISAGTGIELSVSSSGAVAAEQTRAMAAEALLAEALIPTAVKSAPYTAAAGDFVPVDASGAARTITLPSAPANKTRIGVKIIAQAGTPNAVTIAAGGADVFNKAGGSTSLTLAALFQGVLLQYASAGAIWYVTALESPLATPSGAAKLGTDGNIAGAGGSPLIGTVVNGTADTLIDAKGDLLAGTADNVRARIAVGSDGQVLTADAASTPGVKWAAAAGASLDSAATVIAAPSGGDDYPAISAAVLAKPKLFLGGGTFLLNTAGAAGFVPLPLVSGIAIQGAGKDQTILKLSSACTCAFGITPTAVDQLCGNVLIQDLTIDCNNISSTHAVLFYGLTGGASILTTGRTSWQNIRFRRVKLINVPTDTNQRIGVYIRSLTNAGDAFSQAQATITDILVEDYEQQGGVYGVTIDAQDTTSSGLACNVLIDRIIFKGKFRHDTGQPGGGGVSGTNGAHIDIGQQALVGTVRIDECVGSGSNDVGIEIDNARSVYVGVADITDFRNHAIYPRNIGYSVGSTRLPHQVHRYEKVIGRSVAYSQGHGVMSGYHSAVYSGVAYPLGDVSVGVLEYDHQLTSDSRMPLTLNLIDSAYRSVRIDELVCTMLGLSDATNTSQTIQPIVIQPYQDCYVGIKSVRTQLQGTVACNVIAGTVVDDSRAAKVRLEIDRHEVDHQLTFTGSGSEPDIWNFAGPSHSAFVTLSGYLAHMKVLHSSAAIGVHFANTTDLGVTSFLLGDLDFSGAGAGMSGSEIVFTAPSNAATVTQSNLIYQNGTRFGTAAKVIRTPLTFAIGGTLAVASGASNYLPPFYVSLAGAETATIVKALFIVQTGTSATCKLQKNGVDITGFTALVAGTTVGTATPTAVAVAEGDQIALVITAISGTPANLSFTVVLEHTV